MNLRHKIITHIVVDAFDLEQLIRETYGQPEYDIISDMQCYNDSEYEYVGKKNSINNFDVTNIEEFKRTGKGNFLFNTLFQDMINTNVLDEGQYLIKISW